jgi:hypothetical protein
MTGHTGFASPCIDDITRQIGTHMFHTWHGTITCTQDSLQFQALMMSSPSAFISLILVVNSIITSQYYVQSSLSKSPFHYWELTPRTAYTKYSIHHAQHSLSTASSADWQPHAALLPASLSSLYIPCCSYISTFPQLRVNQWIDSQLLSRLLLELSPQNSVLSCTPPILLHHVLYMYFKTRSITAIKYTLSWPSSVYFQICSIMTCKCITILAWLWPPSSHDYHLQMDHLTPWILCSKFALSSSPSVYLQTYTISASKYISKLAQIQAPRVSRTLYDFTLETTTFMGLVCFA